MKVLYGLLVVACALLVATMLTARDAQTRFLAQWSLVGICIAGIVGLAIRGDDEQEP